MKNALCTAMALTTLGCSTTPNLTQVDYEPETPPQVEFPGDDDDSPDNPPINVEISSGDARECISELLERVGSEDFQCPQSVDGDIDDVAYSDECREKVEAFGEAALPAVVQIFGEHIPEDIDLTQPVDEILDELSDVELPLTLGFTHAVDGEGKGYRQATFPGMVYQLETDPVVYHPGGESSIECMSEYRPDADSITLSIHPEGYADPDASPPAESLEFTLIQEKNSAGNTVAVSFEIDSDYYSNTHTMYTFGSEDFEITPTVITARLTQDATDDIVTLVRPFPGTLILRIDN